tara:strand:- start:62546 stop:63436 length:891 start_codon:yes stop_codon:yes gene_type:complete
MSWLWRMALVGLLCIIASPTAIASPYHSHEQVNERLTQLATQYKDIAKVHRVATTSQGREVLALEVDRKGTFDSAAPVLLLHGGIHGNEWISTEVVLHLVELTLASNVGNDLRIHFVPIVNADGFAAGKRKAVDPKGVWYDANREFPVPYEKSLTQSRPLISAFRAYATRGRLVGVLDYHAPAECITWPFAFSRTREPDNAASLKTVVEEMARSVGYCFGQTASIIGYKHQATAQDYFAHEHGAAAVLMELGRLRGPETDYAPQELVEQERPFRIFVAWLSAQIGSAPNPSKPVSE